MGQYRGNSLNITYFRGKTPQYDEINKYFGLSLPCDRSQILSRVDIIWMSMKVIYDIINYIRFISLLISFSCVTYDIKNLSIWYWGRYLIWFYVTSYWYNFDINFDIIYDVIMTLVKSTSYWYHYWYHLWHLLDMDIWYHIDIMMSIFAAQDVPRFS